MRRFKDCERQCYELKADMSNLFMPGWWRTIVIVFQVLLNFWTCILLFMGVSLVYFLCTRVAPICVFN